MSRQYLVTILDRSSYEDYFAAVVAATSGRDAIHYAVDLAIRSWAAKAEREGEDDVFDLPVDSAQLARHIASFQDHLDYIIYDAEAELGIYLNEYGKTMVLEDHGRDYGGDVVDVVTCTPLDEVVKGISPSLVSDYLDDLERRAKISAAEALTDRVFVWAGPRRKAGSGF